VLTTDEKSWKRGNWSLNLEVRRADGCWGIEYDMQDLTREYSCDDQPYDYSEARITRRNDTFVDM
jgi:hypothetical protein